MLTSLKFRLLDRYRTKWSARSEGGEIIEQKPIGNNVINGSISILMIKDFESTEPFSKRVEAWVRYCVYSFSSHTLIQWTQWRLDNAHQENPSYYDYLHPQSPPQPSSLRRVLLY